MLAKLEQLKAIKIKFEEDKESVNRALQEEYITEGDSRHLIDIAENEFNAAKASVLGETRESVTSAAQTNSGSKRSRTSTKSKPKRLRVEGPFAIPVEYTHEFEDCDDLAFALSEEGGVHWFDMKKEFNWGRLRGSNKWNPLKDYVYLRPDVVQALRIDKVVTEEDIRTKGVLGVHYFYDIEQAELYFKDILNRKLYRVNVVEDDDDDEHAPDSSKGNEEFKSSCVRDHIECGDGVAECKYEN